MEVLEYNQPERMFHQMLKLGEIRVTKISDRNIDKRRGGIDLNYSNRYSDTRYGYQFRLYSPQ